jgi:hypothetical protein
MEAISHAKNLMRERCSMPRRSTRITLLNNTPFTLTFLASNRCHGDWTDPWQPPSRIPPNTQGAWQSESSGIATGTEAWVKYLLNTTDSDFATGQPCLPELVYIHWDNPFVWGPHTKPIPDHTVGTSDVTTPCDDGGTTSGTFPPVGGTTPQGCRHELFMAGMSGAGISNVTWWDVIVNWPALLGLIVTGEADVNLQLTLGLRAVGSVGQTIRSLYDGRQGLRSLARTAGRSSFRALFNM